MALTATIHVFDIELADSDRHVYETLALRVARHPSESPEYLVTRVLAYALEFTEGIAFSRGLSEPDAPAIAVHDLTGVMRAWIDVGMPTADRLHRAGKVAARVAVYTHRDPALLLGRLAGQRIHRAEALEIHAIDRALVAALVGRLERRMAFTLAVSAGDLYVTLGPETFVGRVSRHTVT